LKTLFEYADERKQECIALGVDANWILGESKIDAKGVARGILSARLPMGEGVFLDVFERVALKDKHVTRERYSYFLVIDDEEIGGYERHPTHEPAVHRHCGPDHSIRTACDAVAFKAAVSEAWGIVGDHLQGIKCDPGTGEKSKGGGSK
jgi:hypothetical protein